MKLPTTAVIAPEKVANYLLQPREDHDKSGFLALAGYTRSDATRLEGDIRRQLLLLEAVSAGHTPYGEKFLIRGPLTGPNGRSFPVLSVWMVEKATGLTKFITLYPDAS